MTCSFDDTSHRFSNNVPDSFWDELEDMIPHLDLAFDEELIQTASALYYGQGLAIDSDDTSVTPVAEMSMEQVTRIIRNNETIIWLYFTFI